MVNESLKINTSCYTFKKLNFENPLFDKTVDATYIIHLEGNGRYESLYNQIFKYKPTSIVYIVLNKGYKKCKKPSYVNKPYLDITDCNINIFKHAKEMKYNNILILEDDFIFNKNIKKHIPNVNNFLNKMKNKKFYYFLGVIPFILLPYDSHNYKSILSSSIHSVILSKKIREEILKIDQKKIRDWDIFRILNYWNYSYVYYKALCYQLIPETENQKLWAEENIVLRTLLPIFKIYIKYTKLDKQVNPGYPILYAFSKIIIYLILIIFYLCFS